jgi:hypothetical protein
MSRVKFSKETQDKIIKELTLQDLKPDHVKRGLELWNNDEEPVTPLFIAMFDIFRNIKNVPPTLVK